LIATVFSARVASLLDVVENVSNHAGPGRQRGSNACYLRLCPCSSESRCSSVSLVSCPGDFVSGAPPPTARLTLDLADWLGLSRVD
jgi:hypothetical protein